jgi:chemotaxis signal transduction protein
MGIIVDNVSDVVNFEQTEIEEKSKGNPYIFGSVNFESDEVNILNIEKLFKLKKFD